MTPVAATTAAAVDSWQEAVTLAASLLVDLGVATSEYPSACVDIVDEQGPYIVMAPGLALVHARPEGGGLAMGVGCVRLDTPVAFGHQRNDPVDLLLSFCSPDSEEHIHALTLLGKALVKGLAERLRASTSTDQITEQLREVLS